jgi:hypothetical protein
MTQRKNAEMTRGTESVAVSASLETEAAAAKSNTVVLLKKFLDRGKEENGRLRQDEDLNQERL